MATVSAPALYPIKGCGGVVVERAEVLHDGAKPALSAPGAGELVLEVAQDGPALPVDVEVARVRHRPG